MNSFRHTGAATLGTLLFAASLAGCSHGKTTESKQQEYQQAQEAQMQSTPVVQANDLGESQQQPGMVTVERQKQVVKTEKVHDRIPTVTEKTTKADINRMQLRDFMALGLSEGQAKQVILYRTQHGKFGDVAQLNDVPGINQDWLSEHRDQLGVSG